MKSQATSTATNVTNNKTDTGFDSIGKERTEALTLSS